MVQATGCEFREGRAETAPALRKSGKPPLLSLRKGSASPVGTQQSVSVAAAALAGSLQGSAGARVNSRQQQLPRGATGSSSGVLHTGAMPLDAKEHQLAGADQCLDACEHGGAGHQ